MLGGGLTITPIEGRREGQWRGKIAPAGLRGIKCFSCARNPSCGRALSDLSISVTWHSETIGIVFLLRTMSDTFPVSSGEGQGLVSPLLLRVRARPEFWSETRSQQTSAAPWAHWHGGNFVALRRGRWVNKLLLSCLFSWVILTAVQEGRIISGSLLEHLIGSIHTSLHLISPL